MRTRALMMMAACLFLAGCSGGGDMASLQQFVATADAGYHPPVKPMPKIPPPKIVAFNMHHFMDPFEPFSMRLPTGGPYPGQNMPKGPLQHYPLDALAMVGTLSSGPKLWVLITTPNGATYRAHVGSYIGEHYGRIVRITSKKVFVVETVAGPIGWVKQPVTIEIK